MVPAPAGRPAFTPMLMGLAEAILLGVQYRAVACRSALEKTRDAVLPGTAAFVRPGNAAFAAGALPAAPRPNAPRPAQAAVTNPMRHLPFMIHALLLTRRRSPADGAERKHPQPLISAGR